MKRFIHPLSLTSRIMGPAGALPFWHICQRSLINEDLSMSLQASHVLAGSGKGKGPKQAGVYATRHVILIYVPALIHMQMLSSLMGIIMMLHARNQYSKTISSNAHCVFTWPSFSTLRCSLDWRVWTLSSGKLALYNHFVSM